jgi:uncharacterized protein (TIGR02001 family)
MRWRVLLLAATLAAPAAAQTAPPVIVTGGISLEFAHDEYGKGTGASVSADGYVEAEIDGFYLGVYGMVTDERTDDEVDLYLGYRRDLDSGFSYDIGYTRYVYPNDGGDCCGEVTLGLFAALGERLGLGLDLAYDPEARLANAYLHAEYGANERWTLSANYGVYEVEDAPSEQEWDIGAVFTLSDETALDLRWYDGSDYDGYLALAVSFDTTFIGN